MKYLLTCLALCLSLGFAQTTHDVQMFIAGGPDGTEFYFEPVGLYIQPGDTVRFIGVTPHHGVTAYHAQHGKAHRVPDGVPPFSSPIVAVTEAWEYTFDTPGTYDLWCGPHEPWGMVMRVVVGEPGGPAEELVVDFGPEGAFGAAGTVLNDPALNSTNIVGSGSVAWGEISAEAKVQPVPANELVGRIMEMHGHAKSE